MVGQSQKQKCQLSTKGMLKADQTCMQQEGQKRNEKREKEKENEKREKEKENEKKREKEKKRESGMQWEGEKKMEDFLLFMELDIMVKSEACSSGES